MSEEIQKELRQQIEMLKELERNNPVDDARVQLRKSELDTYLDEMIANYNPIARQAFNLYLQQDGVTFEHMLLEIIKCQNETIEALRKDYEYHLSHSPSPPLFNHSKT